MNNSRRFSFIIGVVIGVAIAILEFRGIADLFKDGGERLRERMSRNGSEAQ